MVGIGWIGRVVDVKISVKTTGLGFRRCVMMLVGKMLVAMCFVLRRLERRQHSVPMCRTARCAGCCGHTLDGQG